MFIACGFLLSIVLTYILLKTTYLSCPLPQHLTSRQYNISQYSVAQLAHLPAVVISPILLMSQLVTGRRNGIIGKHLHDTLQIGHLHESIVHQK